MELPWSVDSGGASIWSSPFWPITTRLDSADLWDGGNWWKILLAVLLHAILSNPALLECERIHKKDEQGLQSVETGVNGTNTVVPLELSVCKYCPVFTMPPSLQRLCKSISQWHLWWNYHKDKHICDLWPQRSLDMKKWLMIDKCSIWKSVDFLETFLLSNVYECTCVH